MPPVFGPSSPSPQSLGVAGGGQRDRFPPSVSAKTETSSPSSSSSTTTAPPNAWARRQRVVGLGLRAADEHALAGREAVRLDHAGRERRVELGRGGNPRGAENVLGERLRPLDPRGLRARAEARTSRSGAGHRRRPRRAAPRGRSRPARSRARCTEERSVSASSGRTGWHVAIPAIPGFPGAACSWPISSDCASFQTSACSRPPDPTTSTFMRSSLIASLPVRSLRHGRRTNLRHRGREPRRSARRGNAA